MVLKPNTVLFLENNTFWKWLCICLALATGIFYATHLTNGHDWGDDFSQYIAHARSIAEGKVYKDTGYIQNPDYVLGPEVYPPVFPLLLAPVYSIAGLNLAALKLVPTLCFTGFLLLIWPVFRPYLAPFLVFFITALVALNPYFYLYKENILSEYPFLFFLFLSFYCIRKANQAQGKWKWLYFGLIGVSIYCVYGTRSAGLVLLLAWLGEIFFQKHKAKRWYLFTGVAIAAFGLLFMGQKFYENSSGENYKDQFEARYKPDTIESNKERYYYEAQNFWIEGGEGSYKVWLVRILLWSGLAGVLLRAFKERPSTFEFFVLFYLALTLVWPWFLEIRALFPFYPLVLFYSFHLLTKVLKFNKLALAGTSGVLFLACLFPYFRAYGKIDAGSGENFLRPETTELFRFIETTPWEAKVMFIKPRLLALYTRRITVVPHCPEDPNNLGRYIQLQPISYIILPKHEFQDKHTCLKNWLEIHQREVTLQFENDGYLVYKRN
jgi:4-amino-4-deoxy-L-arabinose transferase-like glycosyltransferase